MLSARYPAHRRGLTLIEVVVTISIIGMVAAVALPAMMDFSMTVDAGPLEPMRALLLDARREAMNGATVEAVVVPSSGRYVVVTRRSDAPPELREGVLQLPGARVSSAEDRFRVVFRPNGLGVGDELSADGVELRVDAATGRITVER
jgi:prepilin-type N-terminal cleavage/methylation domain-containing protein